MVNDTNNNIVYDNDIDKYIHEFFVGESENDIQLESMSRWNASLLYTFNHLFKHHKTHKEDHRKTELNINDIETISNIMDYYIYLCMTYNKEISVYGLCLLCGFDNSMFLTVYSNRFARCKDSKILEKLSNHRHESLKSLLLQGGKTQFGATVILNHDYDYNLPGSNRDVVERRQLNKGEIASQLGITLDSNELLTDREKN